MKAPERFDRSEDYLHEVAHNISGLTDFGSGYMDGLRVCLACMDRDPDFTPAGRELAWDAVVMTLVSRAIAEDNWKKFPEWRDAPISKPVLITGLPRTGTTALHKLMGVDPQFQGVENWITASPMPRPPRDTWAEDPGFLRAMRWLHQQHSESPGVAIAHNVVADELDEQLELQRQSFVSNRWACTWYSPSYDAWWQTQDEHPSFLRELDLMKLIGCHDERRWLLKNPGSIGMLGWWLESVPDVCVIQTHRDPVKSTASISSTLQHIHASFEGEAAERSRRLLGPREMEKWAHMLDAGAPHRARSEANFFDVHHADFHADPMGTIGKIYDRFGLHLSAEAEELMAARIAENPEGHGLHTYDLDSFGLNREMIVERYSHYIERYGIEVAD
ncbi:MAG: sulfotransferase [Novosphingobium sp.]|nr:sulfotransferase [Novosphingobium sp.]MCP5404429.1 sulfotransferase [Novosphingobium sp.]